MNSESNCIPNNCVYERDNVFWVTQAIANMWPGKLGSVSVCFSFKMENISGNTTQKTDYVCLHLRSNYLNGIINKMERQDVSIPTIIGEKLQTEKKKHLFAKETPLQHTQLQRWSHHILKCRMNSLVIHRLNHMNKRSKGKIAD